MQQIRKGGEIIMRINVDSGVLPNRMVSDSVITKRLVRARAAEVADVEKANANGLGGSGRGADFSDATFKSYARRVDLSVESQNRGMSYMPDEG